jgi:5-methylcytosine-specific restriction endonuclease McrA
MPSQPGQIHRAMVRLLIEHPGGLTSGELRAKLNLGAEEQAQLDRRRRDLKKWYNIEKKTVRGRTLYVFRGERSVPFAADPVDSKTRAAVYGAARGRCQMCGRTISTHGITLVVDHKIPRDWGGASEESNLWAICEECNQGKKNLFASYDPAEMRRIVKLKSVHMRIGELLKSRFGQAVSCHEIAFVADQDDWKKRTRDLRYLGWKIDASRKKGPTGRIESAYTLRHFEEWPDDPTRWIRDYEKRRANANKRAMPP